jgi:hypothetical protein
MRATWTDSRLDDLNGRVSGLDGRVEALSDRVDDLGRRLDAGFARVDNDIRELRGEVGALQRTIIQVGGGLIGTLIVASVGVISTQL